MARCSISDDRLDSHNFGITRTCIDNWFLFDLDFPVRGGGGCGVDDYKDKLKSLFDQLLSCFLSEVSKKKHIRPTPALLGDGRPADLFKLFWVVRKRGGYGVVSENCMWPTVAEECGLDVEVTASLKLIYIKYLNELDQWVQEVFRDKISGNEKIEVHEKLDLLYIELEKIRGSFSVGQKKNEAQVPGYLDGGTGKSSADGYIDKVNENVACISDDDESFPVQDDSNIVLSASSVVQRVVNSRNAECIGDDEDKFSVQDENKIVLSARSLVEKVVNCRMRSFSASADISILHENAKRVSENNDEKFQDDENISLPANNVVEKVVNSQTTNFPASEDINSVHETEECINDDDHENFQDDYSTVLSAKSVVEKVINSRKMNFLAGENIIEVNINAESNDDDASFRVQDENCIGSSAKSGVEKVFDSQKRKRESLLFSEMINSVIEVAKLSDDPSIGVIPECSKWKEHGNEDFWAQSLLAREALLTRRVDTDTDESPVQRKPRMHPSMYGDNDVLDQESPEKIRCSERLPLTKSYSCPCCSSCSPTQTRLISPRKAEMKNSPNKKGSVIAEILTRPTTDDRPGDELSWRRVSVGPFSQAEVPAWTGVVSETDSKWLGTCMWPPKDGKQKALIKMDSIGKGRQNSCHCRFPGSTECVRFHTAEKRLKLKCELGLLFYHWRFNFMGEDVSLSWTIDEEKRFMHMVRSNAGSVNKFWSNAFRLFPTRTREKLVSYYFNVLLVRRRRYQNRVTVKDIDSDDDETEFGSVGQSLGLEGIHVPGSKLLKCSQNMQCTELE